MELSHERLGSGEPVLLIHTLGSERGIWAPLLPLLAEAREVIVPDMPGFGQSPPDGEPPTAAALARALSRFVESLGIERPHVAGCSLGDWVALEMAHAGLARSATGLCTAGLWAQPLGPRSERARRNARLSLPMLSLTLRAERGRRLALGSVMTHPERVPRAAALTIVRSYALSPAFPEASRLMRSARFERLAEIDVPVTLAWGEHDRLITKPRSLPPNVRSLDLPGCGHVPMWDDPELVARVLLEASAA